MVFVCEGQPLYVCRHHGRHRPTRGDAGMSFVCFVGMYTSQWRRHGCCEAVSRHADWMHLITGAPADYYSKRQK